APIGGAPLDAAAAAHLEALGSSLLRLHLRHCNCSFFHMTPGGPAVGRLMPRLSLVWPCRLLQAAAGFAETFFASGFGFAGAAAFAFGGGIPFFFGAITITICRPSSLGNCSTTPTSSRSLRTRSSSRSPNSLCAISRPRNRNVTLALSPSSRNATSLPSLIL